MTATDTVPEIDVWGWTTQPTTSLDQLMAIKKAVLLHPQVRRELESRFAAVENEEKEPRTCGLARWMLAQYHRAWPLLRGLDSKDPAIEFAKAECCLKGRVAENDTDYPMRRPDLAVEIIQKTKDLAGEHRAIALRLDAMIYDHDLEPAEKGLEAAPQEFQESAHGLYVRGRIHEHAGDYREARSAYLKAIEKDPGHRGALLRLAYQHDLGGDDEEAMDYYKRLSALRPLDVHATLNYGILLEDMERWDEAIRCYRSVLAAFPNHTRALSYLRDALGSLNMVFDEDVERRHDKRNQLLRIPISDFELSVRARNCLSKMNIETLGDLVIKSESELLAYKNFGETSLSEIKVLLESKGLRLGMDLNEDPIPTAIPESIGAEKARPPVELPPGVDPSILGTILADLELSVRCRKALAQLKAVSVGDLLHHSEAELLSLKNFGQTSLSELKVRLAEFGVSLRPN